MQQYIKILLILALFIPAIVGANSSKPYLKYRGEGIAQLYVEGKPFLILGGELLNSSGSTSNDMQSKWKTLKALNLNTILIAVPWEQVEMTHGCFDFSEFGKIIEQAKKNNIKLVPLWFGSWKNGGSGYVPHWVMRDTKKYPRMEDENGAYKPVLSNLSEEVLNADKTAFLEFIKFIKEKDPKGETVIMVQIENEVGLLGDSRDRSAVAEKAFASQVPNKLIEYIKNNEKKLLPEIRDGWNLNGKIESGSWEEVFGQKNKLADEMFMAWNYATFIEKLAAEGKKIHNLPMFVNAWGINPTNPPPGKYPSGGPNYRMFDVWKAAAPSIDFLSIDIYQKDYKAKIAQFARNGNPIFIPEACGVSRCGGAKAFYTIGKFGAIGFSPFAIDHPSYTKEHPLAAAYKVLSNISHEIAKCDPKKDMFGFMQQDEKSEIIDLGDIKVKIEYEHSFNGYGIIIRLSNEDFLIAGTGATLKFSSDDTNRWSIAYGLIRQGHYEKDGKWITEKYLGGDEALGGVSGIKLSPEYTKIEAKDNSIITIRAHIFKVK